MSDLNISIPNTLENAGDDPPAPSLRASSADRGNARPECDPEEPVADATASIAFPIVGIGASAGGLEALETFFDNMPADSGMAFVVVQHLSPDFKSVMDELLARHTRITIHRVSDGMTVEPNAIYLIPPKKEMIVQNGRLLLSDKEPGSALALPIDLFFRSLAQDAGRQAVGIVLSGTGSDGSRGIADIHRAGGLVLAQDLDSAKFDGMPKSAAETGVVDYVLPPERMPGALLSYIRHPGADDLADFAPPDPALLEGFDAIFQLLRKAYDIDFSYYKRATVTRRVQRRLEMSQVTDLDEYVARLRNDTNELNLLYRDLLIGVTKFFRDGAAFEQLERRVLPELLKKLQPGGELRIWVAGCATGEEAYSLAILVHELLERSTEKPSVKIFATDVHRASLEIASAGVYSAASLSEVSNERLERYFTRVKGGYHVSPDLRQMIVFAPHNLIKDAPFTKINLITCRNLLIYLEPLAQKKVISLFHFALHSSGVLWMGPSETPGELADEFDSIDDHWRIYRKRRDKRLTSDVRLPSLGGYAAGRMTRSAIVSMPAAGEALAMRAYEELLREYAPPSLLINDRRELLHSFSGASEFLKLRDGRPSSDIFELLLPDLKIPVTTAVAQAAKSRTAVTYTGVRCRRGEELLHVEVCVRPVANRGADEACFLISFKRIIETRPFIAGEADKAGDGAMDGVMDGGDRRELDLNRASQDRLSDLEGELRHTRENLQATLEEMETSNEELQATNEELVASNEELQSTNEELHSVNEELYTVNAEYQKKIGELMEITADLDSLLQSTEVGVIYLDRDLCIRKFTPKIGELFHLLPLDVGRRIDSFAHQLDLGDLFEDIKRVLTEETPFETEVSGIAGKTHLLRILPYRTKTKRVDGVVMTLIDISRVKRVEADLRRMSKVFLDGADPIVIESLDGRIIDLNDEAVKIYSWPRSEAIGSDIDELVPVEERVTARDQRRLCLERGGVRNWETRKQTRRGETFPALLSLSLITDARGEPSAIASIAKDITDRKRAEETARAAVRSRDQFLAMLSHELRNPLSAALNASYLLDRADLSNLTPEAVAAARIVQRQTLQAARLLDDLLDVARVTQGKIEIRKQVVELAHLIEDAAQAVQPAIAARAHRLEVVSPDEPICVEGDPARLLQILENLLANAAKYTPAGGSIRLSIEADDGSAVIRVRDNGRGLPAHMRDKIFDLFVQSDDTLDRADGGMGLGLTLVKTLVELHGGEVSVTSDGVGKGCEFSVRLPLAPTKQCAPEPVLESSQPLTPKRIVLVEDNEDSRTTLQTLLSLEGHQVTTAKDGRQGLELILRLRPDAAIVDVGLPGMNGYEVARKVRAELGKTAVRLIALTGYGRSEDRQNAQEAGFDHHLVKPLKPEELSRILSVA